MKKTIVLIFIFLVSSLFAQRIKDVAYFKGVNSEQLIGYGLVVGLAGTGDSYRSSFTIQSVTSMLKRFGVTVPDDSYLRTRNIAAVMVTSKLSNMLKEGSEFDVNVSSMGDATSLMGGTLLLTPLSLKDGNVIATCQGPISVGGYDINTSSGSRIVKNHALSGRIPNGGTLLGEMQPRFSDGTTASIVLKSPDFTTAKNIADALNQRYPGAAAIKDASEIVVSIPANFQNNIPVFLAEMEGIQVQTDAVAKVVLNERTGTVVSGTTVRILPVTISHGSLKIEIKSYPVISQPGPFSQGNTVLYNNLVPSATQEEGNAISIAGATNVQEVATALNSLKVSPRDIIAIFQALKEAGALQADLVIM